MIELDIENSTEFDVASSELRNNRPTECLRRFYTRLDSVSIIAMGEADVPTACKDGCSYCCYYKVVASPVEVFSIVEYVKNKFSKAQMQALSNRLNKNVDEARHLSEDQHLVLNQKCPFLEGNSCSIYKVRPLHCRTHHSVDVAYCKKSFEQPDNMRIQQPILAILHSRSKAVVSGFTRAIEASEIDNKNYDFCSSVLEALQNPKSSSRFSKGKRAFLAAKKNDS